jgi:hypothetical protein
MAMVLGVFHHVLLAMQLQVAVPAIDPAVAFAHAGAALRASTARVDAELLLAIAYVESRFDATATSRVEGAARKTGSYPWSSPPARLDARASLYCGPLQTFAGSWRECMALRELPAAYAAGAHELEQWLRDRRVHGRVELALAGHGCGNHGVDTGHCNAYPARVLVTARRIASAAAASTSPASSRPRTST